MSSSVKIVLSRNKTSKTASDLLKKQINMISNKALAGNRGQNWKFSKFQIVDGNYVLVFGRTGGREETAFKQANEIVETIRDYGKSSSWGKNPWEIVDVKLVGIKEVKTSKTNTDEDDVNFDRALTIEEIGEILDRNDILINGWDAEIEKHEAFQGIYDRGPIIRVCFSSIRRYVNTEGKRRHHILLWGPPGCAKSHIFAGIRKVLGPGAYYDLNNDSSTKAGIQEKLLRLHDAGIGIPPVVFVEEMEKAQSEHITSPWLSILDDRRELRKLTAFKARRIDINVLVLATCNDKRLFDNLHGGRPGYPGALSSRFSKQLHVPRPTWEVLRRILMREIQEFGGNPKWIQPCIELANELDCDDPRLVISFLDGEDRLLSGDYQNDILAIMNKNKTEEEGNAFETELKKYQRTSLVD